MRCNIVAPKHREGRIFFTLVTHNRRPILCQSENIHLLREAFQYGMKQHPFKIDAIVILPDHLHCLWTLPQGDADFSTRWRLIKGWFSRRCDERYQGKVSTSRQSKQERAVWQRRFWEHLIRDEQDFINHVDYIHYNPVHHGLVSCPKDWEYSSFHRYVQRGIYDVNWGSSVEMEELLMLLGFVPLPNLQDLRSHYTFPKQDKNGFWYPSVVKNRPWHDSVFKISIQSLENRLNAGLPEERKYDFLRNIPDFVDSDNPKFKNKKEEIKKTNTGNKFLFPVSSLLAEPDGSQEELFFSKTITNTPIGHNSIVKTALSEFDFRKVSSPEVSASKISLNKFNFLDNNRVQPSSTKDCLGKVITAKSQSFDHRTTQVSPDKVSTKKITPSQIGFRQISPTEIGMIKSRHPEFGSTQNSITQVDSSKVKLSDINITQINTTKISFSSTVTSDQIFPQTPEQFFISTHNFNPQIINNLNNSATNIWSNLLQSSTQLDITFQITDLPTGQLAEATITGFDPFGRPNAGTILIDYNANGIGWFIDPTPLTIDH